MEPRNDYELLTLARRKMEGTPTELRAWVDEQLQIDIQLCGTEDAVLESATQVLNSVIGQTGVRRAVLAPRIHGSCMTLAQTAPWS